MKVLQKNKSQPLSHTTAINILLMRYLWLMFRIGYLKWLEAVNYYHKELHHFWKQWAWVEHFQNSTRWSYSKTRSNETTTCSFKSNFFHKKKINKEIMKRSWLRTNFLNTKVDIDRKAYNKQGNLCVSLIRRKKKNLFNNISTREIIDNKTFWKTVKPFFTDKVQIKFKLTLIEKRFLPEKGKSK